MSDSIGISDTIMDTSNASVHTLQRHRDILRDYTQEFEKTKRNIIQFREREKLFSMNSNSLNSNSLGGLNNRRFENNSTTLYLKESEHLKKYDYDLRSIKKKQC
jgi:golgi SNAP receptor complex member 1